MKGSGKPINNMEKVVILINKEIKLRVFGLKERKSASKSMIDYRSKKVNLLIKNPKI